MNGPSPRPWTLESTNANGWKGLSIRAADGLYVANLVTQPFADNERENGKLIVRAGNAHDDLLEALRGLYGLCPEGHLDDKHGLWADARKAIAKAEGR